MNTTAIETNNFETVEITDELMYALNAIEPGAGDVAVQKPIEFVQNLPVIYLDTFETFLFNAGQFVLNIMAVL